MIFIKSCKGIFLKIFAIIFCAEHLSATVFPVIKSTRQVVPNFFKKFRIPKEMSIDSGSSMKVPLNLHGDHPIYRNKSDGKIALNVPNKIVIKSNPDGDFEEKNVKYSVEKSNDYLENEYKHPSNSIIKLKNPSNNQQDYGDKPDFSNSETIILDNSEIDPKDYLDNSEDDKNICPPSRIWMKYKLGDKIPKTAVEGGYDTEGFSLYIGRREKMGGLIPGKISAKTGLVMISWNGEEWKFDDGEILLVKGPYAWVRSNSEEIPQNLAVLTGNTRTGESLFSGRFIITDYVSGNNSLTIGKVHPSHQTCYIPFLGKEYGNEEYEIFVENC